MRTLPSFDHLAQATLALLSAVTLTSCMETTTGLFSPSVASAPSSSAGGLGAPPPQKTQQIAAIRPKESAPTTATPATSALPQSAFSGMTASALKAQWGEPGLQRHEAGGALWQFTGKACVVLAYLYPNAGGELETSYVEARPGGITESAVQSCLKGPRVASMAPSRTDRNHPRLILKPN